MWLIVDLVEQPLGEQNISGGSCFLAEASGISSAQLSKVSLIWCMQAEDSCIIIRIVNTMHIFPNMVDP